MVTLSVYLTLFLLTHHTSFGAINFDKFYNFDDIFDKCAANNSNNNCVCMNTVPAEFPAKDPRRQITSYRCYGCTSSCSTAFCGKLPDCTAACQRVCLCSCPNATTTAGRTIYIPCVNWCANGPFCPAVACKPEPVPFRISTTGVAVVAAVLAFCFVGRLFQKLRRKRFFLRQPNQQTTVVAEEAANEEIQLPPREGHTLPEAAAEAAPPYSVVTSPDSAPSAGGDEAANPPPVLENEAPPDYETVVSNLSVYRTEPPKYS